MVFSRTTNRRPSSSTPRSMRSAPRDTRRRRLTTFATRRASPRAASSITSKARTIWRCPRPLIGARWPRGFSPPRPITTQKTRLERLLGYVDFRGEILQGDLPDYTCLLGTLVQETYATHPNIRAACDKGMSTHIAILRAMLKPPKSSTRPMRHGAPKASATSSNRFCRAHSFSPRQSKVPRSCARVVSRICGDTWDLSSTSRVQPSERRSQMRCMVIVRQAKTVKRVRCLVPSCWPQWLHTTRNSSRLASCKGAVASNRPRRQASTVSQGPTNRDRRPVRSRPRSKLPVTGFGT